MAHRLFSRSLRYNGVPLSIWLGALVVALAVLFGIEYFETSDLAQHAPANGPFVFRLGGYANLLLVGSALLYIIHSWFGSSAAGRWATSFATVGAAAALIALAVRWFETYYLQRPAHLPLGTQHDIIALFNAFTVVIYLIMERIYRNRSAGAFVMMIVLAAVLFQAWLSGHELAAAGQADGALRTYWMHAHVLGIFAGYGAFAAAAAMAIAYLIHGLTPIQRIRFGLAPFAATALQPLERLMHHAILFGFISFSMATALGALWAFHAWGRFWAWEIKETWAFAVWLAYATLLWLRHIHGWSGKRMAWWAIGAFVLALLCLLAAHLLGAATYSMHSPHVHVDIQGAP